MRKSRLVNLGHPEVTVELPWVRVGQGEQAVGVGPSRCAGKEGDTARTGGLFLFPAKTGKDLCTLATSLREQWRTWAKSGHVKALSSHIRIYVRRTESAANWP